MLLMLQAQTQHTNNWAVLVDTSRFWFNYRHVANVLSIYRSVKRLGIPDRCAKYFKIVIFKSTNVNFDILVKSF
jgi:glycosylphosphatidylinositol transamidase (GPIT) subunit GPI8